MKKFIQSSLLENMEVLTDTGWIEVMAIHKTVPYVIFEIKTASHTLKCADDHILFNNKMEEIFVKDLIVGDIIITESGGESILKIINTNVSDNMYDIELGYMSNERYYTNGVLSHNTTYLKYLTKLIKGKEILFIPPSMAEMLSEPSIIPFLMDNRNSILIIEDAERVIGDRTSGNASPAGVSNLLNLTDGILGDCLNIQVIATFNMKREKIDQALLRKGRLICEWDFKPLSVDDSNKLLKKIFPKKNYATTRPMLLSDIYGFDTDDLSVKTESIIGFK